MAQNISVADVLSAKNLIDYTSLAPVQPRVLSELFPETKQSELTIEMIRGASDKPVTAHIHAFDTEAEIGDREGFKKDIADLALIKKKIPLREKEIIALEHPRTDAEFNMVRNQVYNDVDRLVESIYTRVEAMRGEALTTGRLVINENNYRQTINYGVPNNHKGSHTWSTGTPDILGDIYTDVDTIVADTGFERHQSENSHPRHQQRHDSHETPAQSGACRYGASHHSDLRRAIQRRQRGETLF